MGIAAPLTTTSYANKVTVVFSQNNNKVRSHHTQLKPMSQPEQEESNMFAFTNPNGFDRSMGLTQQDQIHQHNYDKLMLRGLEPTPPSNPGPPLVGADGPTGGGLQPVYDQTAGMLSEMDMYNFGHGAPEMLDYRRAAVGGMVSNPEWYGSRPQVARDSIGDRHHHHHHHNQHQQMHNDTPPSLPPPPPLSSISTDSAAAMQLFIRNPQRRSPSPSSQQPPAASGSTLHMLLRNPSTIQPDGGFHPINPNFWASHIDNHPPGPEELGGMVESKGLSLSLSSSLQHLEAAKQAEEYQTMGGGENPMLFFSPLGASSSTSTSSQGHFFKHLASNSQPILQGTYAMPGPNTASGSNEVHIRFGSAMASSSIGAVNALRNSRYAKPAQELLEEFCSVGRGQLHKSKLTRQNSNNPNPNQNPSTSGGGGSLSMKDPPQLSPADRIEHQRRKVKLLAMVDEVDRRYNHYCEQMQMVVNSFDMVMGYGAAVPYTALAQKAMSRHFRCLKDAIQRQLRQSCELLGEKDPTASSGLTKGETPRLKLLEQSLRQQRAFHHIGMMDQDAWRPQRGLPERSVNVLRAWLFEHFLHPYPSDADKHLLARQTGLSRSQVSNWFINARVRLWKPMVEEMYQQEAKEGEDERERTQQSSSSTTSNTNTNTNTQTIPTQSTHNPMPPSSVAESMTPPAPPPPAPNADPSYRPISTLHHQQQPPPPPLYGEDDAYQFGVATSHSHDPDDDVGSTSMIRFGTTTGDVSLTLGLRHAGNAPDQKTPAFSVRDFGSC